MGEDESLHNEIEFRSSEVGPLFLVLLKEEFTSVKRFFVWIESGMDDLHSKMTKLRLDRGMMRDDGTSREGNIEANAHPALAILSGRISV